MNDISKYSDIIDLKYLGSKHRKRMSIENRAVQFAPFSALTGYSEAVNEVARITDKKIILADNKQDVINEKLMIIKENILEKKEVTIRYFVPDNKKSGGKYVSVCGCIKRIDVNMEKVYMLNGCVIDFNNIVDINSDLFDTYEF